MEVDGAAAVSGVFALAHGRRADLEDVGGNHQFAPVWQRGGGT